MSESYTGDLERHLQTLGPTQLNAALSKLFAASVGDVVLLFSRSPAHKHYSLADIEWMILPPVSAGQFYVVEMVDKERGFRAPIAVVTWAFVSKDLDQQLGEQLSRPFRLRPDQWKCGEIAWLIDAVGNSEGVTTALQWLTAGPLKGQRLKVAIRDEGGKTTIKELNQAAMLRTETAAS